MIILIRIVVGYILEGDLIRELKALVENDENLHYHIAEINYKNDS